MSLVSRAASIVAAGMLSLGMTCAAPSSPDISRERAISIARSQVSFEPTSIDAERVMSGTRPVWRVAFRGTLPGQPPGLFETVIVDVDRQTGDIISVARP